MKLTQFWLSLSQEGSVETVVLQVLKNDVVKSAQYKIWQSGQ